MEFLRLKFYFITLFFGYGCILPYLSLFYKSTLGFGAFEIGVLTSMIPVANFILLPFFTMITDRYQCPKLILVLCSLLSSVVTVALYWVTASANGNPVPFSTILLLMIAFASFLAPQNSILDSIILDTLDQAALEASERSNAATSARVQAVVATAVEVEASARSPTGSPVRPDGQDDRAALTQNQEKAEQLSVELSSGSQEKKEVVEGKMFYGRQRMLGSLAYGSAGFLMAFLVHIGPTSPPPACVAESVNRTMNGESAARMSVCSALNETTSTSTPPVGSTTSGGGEGLALIFFGYVLSVGLLFVLALVWPERQTWRRWFRMRRRRLRKNTSLTSELRSPPMIVSEQQQQLKNKNNNVDDADVEQQQQLVQKTFRLPSQTSLASDPQRRRRRSSAVSSVRSVVLPAAPTPNTGCSYIPRSEDKSVSLAGAIGELLHYSSPAGSPLRFWLFVFVQGFSLSIINNYVFFMLVDRLNAANAVLGLINLMRVALEIPFFYWSHQVTTLLLRLVRRQQQPRGSSSSSPSLTIDAMRWTMALSMVLLSVRCGLYAAMSYFRWDAYSAPVVELLHGVIYATFYSSAVQIASAMAPVHLQATSQGLFGAVFSGLGSTLGSLVGGVLNETMGSTFLYVLLFGLNAVVALFQVLSIQTGRSTTPAAAVAVGGGRVTREGQDLAQQV